MKHRVLTLLFTALLLAPAGGYSAAQPELKRYEGSVDAMGGAFTIVAYGEDGARLETSVAAALEEARRLDNMLSNYRPESEWSRVNQLAGKRPVHVSRELFDLLSACVEYSRESEGTFDITVGPLMKVWGFYKGTGHLPHRAEVRGALDRIGWRNIVLDSANQTVRFARPGVEMDPGGIGKGYTVDRMASILERQGIRRALISGASSSIYAIGAPPRERGWKLSIKDPRDRSKTSAEVWLKDQSMSTSGNYEKFFYAEGKMYSHIMDPRSGYPSMGTLSVSIISPRTIDSEAWAKPYYILGRDWTAKHKKKDFRVYYCEDRLDTPCAWLQ
ncbi:MAG TPA: FAD:protein FMN transferase [Bryobacteraceae bacterium]|nr:FAD:protein FMN transferase [Bryobacteraceae bacterium]